MIGDDGEQLGVMTPEDAIVRAEEGGLDLVEVAPGSRPPVCRIMDYGRYKYEQKKKEQASRKKQHQGQVKEVRLRPKIAEHDIQVKVRRARRFIEQGDKVQLNCLFRGREMAHQELGLKVLHRVVGDIEEMGKVEQMPRMEGRQMTMVVAPLK